MREIRASLGGLLTGERSEAFQSRRTLHEIDGLDPETAGRLATIRYLDEFLPIASLAVKTGADAAVVAAVYLGLAEEIDFPWMRNRLEQLAAGDVWANRGARILVARLEDARIGIAARILDGFDGSPDRALERFRHANAVDLSRVRNVLSDIRTVDRIGLAALLVAVDAVGEMDALEQA